MSDEFEVYKYKSLTKVLSEVYADYINVDGAEMKETTPVVMSIFEEIERAMCKEDRFFARLFLETTIGGSVGDDLKVIVADEYDLDMVLELPKCFTVYPSNIPGYVHLKEKYDIRRIKYLPDYLKFTEDSYLLPKQLLSWTHSLLNRALNTFSTFYRRSPLIETKHGQCEVTGVYGIKPGFTISLDLKGNEEEEVSVDVVPCFECDCSSLPEKYRQQISEGKCLLIPKVPARDIPCKERYWRLCFQDYERDLLHNKQVLKPTIKLLKALKEKLDTSAICSYHIKAICLYELQKAGQNEFWKESLGHCFIRLLQACIYHIGNGKIPAVYDNKCNLIEHVHISHCKQVSSKLKAILDDVVRSPDTRIIASHLLHEDDFQDFMDEFTFSEKYRALLWDRGYNCERSCNML